MFVWTMRPSTIIKLLASHDYNHGNEVPDASADFAIGLWWMQRDLDVLDDVGVSAEQIDYAITQLGAVPAARIYREARALRSQLEATLTELAS